MELSEREWDVIRRALWHFAGMNDRWGEQPMEHTDWCNHRDPHPPTQAVARDLYFRFSHELV